MNKTQIQEPPEVVEVQSTRVCCDGGLGGHPRVWLHIAEATGWVECPYCDCRYVLRPAKSATGESA